MLRIPHSKIYRAFPELDRFSDEDCELFMQRARAQGGFEVWVRTVHIGASVALFIAAIVISMILFEPLMRLFRPPANRIDAENYAIGVCMFFVAVMTCFGGLIARDIAYLRLMRRVIHLRLDKVRCRGCGYSLLGQIARDRHVRCPECGVMTTLGELGLKSASELLPPRTAREEAGLTE